MTDIPGMDWAKPSGAKAVRSMPTLPTHRVSGMPAAMPTMPATTGPVWMPMRILMDGIFSFSCFSLSLNFVISLWMA